MIRVNEVSRAEGRRALSYCVGNRAATELRQAAEQRIADERELYRVNRKLELLTKLDSLTALQKELQRHEPWFVGRERHWLAKTACAKNFKAALTADAEEIVVEEIEDMLAWCVASIFSAEQLLRPLRPLKAEQDRIEQERVEKRERERLEAEIRRAAEVQQHKEFLLHLTAERASSSPSVKVLVEMTKACESKKPRFPPRHHDPNWWRKRFTIKRW